MRFPPSPETPLGAAAAPVRDPAAARVTAAARAAVSVRNFTLSSVRCYGAGATAPLRTRRSVGARHRDRAQQSATAITRKVTVRTYRSTSVRRFDLRFPWDHAPRRPAAAS
ncbi:hypothetical protein GCM10010524_09830 [Streptomyces mexicanus]